ncbi:MAG: secondary thiamine-phosphate synthase enzyme YjbQ [Candidatus Bathyarchaeia archaeon]
MKVYTDRFEFDTRGEFNAVDLTAMVNAAVERSGVQRGIAVVYAGHATGVIVLNEYESNLLDDLRDLLRRLVPPDGGYHHHGNASAHLRSMILTPSRVVPVHGGRLGLGTWQSLYWVEVERRARRRRVEVTVIGS